MKMNRRSKEKIYIKRKIKNNFLFYKIKTSSLNITNSNINSTYLECINNNKNFIKTLLKKNIRISRKLNVIYLFNNLKTTIDYIMNIENMNLLEFIYIKIYNNKILYGEILFSIKSIIMKHYEILENRFILTNELPGFNNICNVCKINELNKKKRILNFIKKKNYNSIYLKLFNFGKDKMLKELKSIKTYSEYSIINLWIIYLKINNLYCKNNKLYKFNQENKLVYYGDILYLKKNIKEIYIKLKYKFIYYKIRLPNINIMEKIISTYIENAYKLVTTDNNILNIN